jgi:hypothetical protein
MVVDESVIVEWSDSLLEVEVLLLLRRRACSTSIAGCNSPLSASVMLKLLNWGTGFLEILGWDFPVRVPVAGGNDEKVEVVTTSRAGEWGRAGAASSLAISPPPPRVAGKEDGSPILIPIGIGQLPIKVIVGLPSVAACLCEKGRGDESWAAVVDIPFWFEEEEDEDGEGDDELIPRCLDKAIMLLFVFGARVGCKLGWKQGVWFSQSRSTAWIWVHHQEQTLTEPPKNYSRGAVTESLLWSRAGVGWMQERTAGSNARRC